MEHKQFSSQNGAAAAPRVLLTNTNRWAGAAQLAIGLSQRGIDVAAVCPTQGHPLLKTRAVRQTFPYSGLRPLESLVAAIKEAKPQIIIPTDDHAVQHLHELHARAHTFGTSGSQIAALIEGSLGPPESYAKVSSRYEFLEIAREEGLRVPETKLIASLEDLQSWHSELTPPWVMKIDGTWSGRGVTIAHDLQQAEQSFSNLPHLFGAARAIKRLIVNRDPFWLRSWWKGTRPSVTIQSYIQGRPANCAVVCWKGSVLAGIAVEVVSAEGLTGPASIVRVVDNPEMMRSAERVAGRLGLSGFFGLDFMIEDGSGRAYLIEMNPRCTPLCHLQLGKGRDMTEALWAQLSGQRPRETAPVTTNDLIAYFPQAWQDNSEFLDSSFQDIPSDEPDLVKMLLGPWQSRSLLYRIYDYMQKMTMNRKESKDCIFPKTLPTRRSVD